MASKTFPFQIIIGAIDRFSSTFATFGAKMDRLGQKAQRMGQDLSLRVTAPLVLLAKSSLDTQIQLEALEAQMVGAMGSQAKAAEQMKWLRQEADRMGVSFPVLTQSYAGFSAAALAAGFTIEQVNEQFIQYSETATSLKASNERVGYIFKALEQMASKPNISMEELKQQLSDHLPGAMALAAKAAGLTYEQFTDAVEGGLIKSKDFMPAYAKLVRETLGGGFEEAADSTAANLNRSKNSLFDFRAQLSQAGIDDIFKKIYESMARVGQAFMRLDEQGQNWIVWAGLAVAVMGPLIFAFGLLVSGIAMLMTPLTLVVAGIAAVAGAAAYAGAQFGALINEAGGIGRAFSILAGIVVDVLLLPFTALLKVVEKVWSLLGTPPQSLSRLRWFEYGGQAADAAVGAQGGGGGGSPAQEYRDTYALQQRALQGDKAAIEILFKNAPPGTKATVVENSGANVTVDQGVSMGGAY